MVKITVEALRALQNNPNNIRNFSVVAHVDHGKSTLTDSLLYSNDMIAKDDVGVKRATDTRPDEALKGITIKSTGVSLFYEMPEVVAASHPAVISKGREFLVNLIDCPGHVDFSSEVTAALRLTDGALVLVDVVEGCCVQTETVLRQALAERIKPVLAVNKLDRAFLELHKTPEEIYKSMSTWINSVNAVISTFQDDTLGNFEVYPNRGTVCFSAGRQGWAFSLRTFARVYAKKMGVNEDVLVEKFWGDNFWDPAAKKWTNSSTSINGEPLQRGFCQFILEPIGQVFKACMEGDNALLDKLLGRLNLALTSEERAATGKDLLKNVMQKWLPAADALLEMIAVHLPSPVEAQKYRVELLYTGPLDDETAEAIRKCDPNGPLVMFISKMIPSKDNSRFFAFGRVFSGTVTNTKVRVMGANYVRGKKDDLAVNHPIQKVVIMMGGKSETIESVPCGNTCALMGIDTVLAKSGTVTTSPDSWPLVAMKYSVSPVVRVAVSCKNPADLPKLVEGLRRFSKTDPLVQVIIEATGEYVLACAGDLHLEISLNDLREFVKCDLVVSQPVVPFQETITNSSIKCLAKSPNGHNRLFMTAEPLQNELVEALVKKEITAQDEPKARALKLVNEFNWDPTEARKIWAFGPEIGPTNVLVDATRGVQYMNEIKETVITGFQYVANKGILAEEPLRGVRFNILDAMVHADAIHRGAGQIVPSAQRAMYASQLTAQPRLLEPIFLVDIQCSSNSLGGVYSTINQKRGVVIETSPRFGTPLYNVKAYLPVTESFGFTAILREQTSGQAFPQLVFDHWAMIPEDPLVEGSKANQIVKEIRHRRGIETNVPALDRFLDKM
eukprot:TRINITY_DN4491_c0_g1_i2.p1 TRINITY_DN4491_c0_g1~~TRINITY_DN4491_c0_g1_i2.p1  ORF type:complete len:842 (-),score=308.92 TRINITY_DN4491_c0_g1_i2:90-2615(-)